MQRSTSAYELKAEREKKRRQARDTAALAVRAAVRSGLRPLDGPSWLADIPSQPGPRDRP